MVQKYIKSFIIIRQISLHSFYFSELKLKPENETFQGKLPGRGLTEWEAKVADMAIAEIMKIKEK